MPTYRELKIKEATEVVSVGDPRIPGATLAPLIANPVAIIKSGERDVGTVSISVGGLLTFNTVGQYYTGTGQTSGSGSAAVFTYLNATPGTAYSMFYSGTWYTGTVTSLNYYLNGASPAAYTVQIQLSGSFPTGALSAGTEITFGALVYGTELAAPLRTLTVNGQTTLSDVRVMGTLNNTLNIRNLTGTYTLTEADAGRVIDLADNRTLSLPATSTIPIGSMFYVMGTGTISVTGGNINNTMTSTSMTGGLAVLIKKGDGQWMLSPIPFKQTLIQPVLRTPIEPIAISATASTGTIQFDTVSRNVLYYTANASGNFTVNVRGDSGTTLASILAIGQSTTVAFMCTNGATPYYCTGVTVDTNATVTLKWLGGAPGAGNANSIDVYTFNIIRTGTSAFTVLASQSKFA